MDQIYKIKEYYEKGSFPKKTAIKQLNKIIRNNIFGIDLNPHAVNLTKLSLSLAICQLLSPREIWTELSFEDLGQNNILQKDFFSFISDKSNEGNYDFIIGNPPFNPPIAEREQEQPNGTDYCRTVIEEYGLKSEPIGDNDLALLFLQQSIKLLKRNEGLLCLIQKSIPLLHTKENESFRKRLFGEFNVPQIIDFTPYRRILFPNATVPTCAVFVENKKPDNNNIAHIVIKRTKSGKERLFFEIDTYDIHSVNKIEAHLSYVWKTNLFGGYKLLNLIKKLNQFPKVKDFIKDEKNRKGNWPIEYLNNYPARGLFLYTKITHGKFPEPIDITEANSSTWGVVGDEKKIKELKDYFKDNGKLLCSYIAGTSARQGLDRIYDLYAEDIRNLPLLNNSDFEKLSISDRIVINDITDYRISEFGDPERSPTNKDIFVRGGNTPEKIINFCETYIEALNSVYNKNNCGFFLREVAHTPSCFILQFEFSKELSENISDIRIKYFPSEYNSLTEFNSPVAFIKKVSFIYNYNKITMIKPKQLRFWLRSIALIDADTSIADIVNYKAINSND